MLQWPYSCATICAACRGRVVEGGGAFLHTQGRLLSTVRATVLSESLEHRKGHTAFTPCCDVLTFAPPPAAPLPPPPRC
jgi:hypothetical protein